MELKEAIEGWLNAIASQPEKTAQAVPQDNQDDKDPAMPPGRLLIDGAGTRTAIFDTVKEAVSKRFPVENDKYRLELHDVKYEGPTEYNLEQQKQAILHNRKLGCSLAGTWRLVDKSTGKVLEEKRDAVLRVPYYTNRGTIINNGSEYTVISQARLSPGVYTRKKQNGDLESQFNVANGKGFRLELDKATGRMNFRMGQANLPLYPVLRAFGMTDQQLAKAWGSDVALANSAKNDPKTVQKLYEKVAGYAYDPLMTESNQAEYIKSELAKFGLDPNTVVRTLGLENVKGVTPEVLLRASQKLLNVNRGIEEPDNRDNPRFSKFYGIEHMLGERIEKDSAKLMKQMLFKVGRDKSLARIGRNALGPYIDDFLSTSGLAQPGEEANPMSILVQQSRITRTGEGGISSPDLITPEARGVQGDYLGFVDFLAGPESAAAGVDVRGSYGAVIGKDHQLYNIFRNIRTGKKEYLSISQAADKCIAFPDQDPKAPYMYAMRNGVPTKVKTSEVDYMVPSFSRTIGAGINMNPLPTAVFGMRSFYSSKFWEQYLPQKNGEVPFVESLMPDGKMTFNEYYGRKAGCVTAPFSGTVTSVTKDGITVKGKNGKTQTFDMVTNLPYNRMTQYSLFPLVKKGQEVSEGDILANSNFTDPKTGAFNMGHNLKVAILPGTRGANSVTGDTLVLWKKRDGGFTFSPIEKTEAWEGMSSVAMNPDDLSHDIIPCHSWMIHAPESDLYEITTLDGMKVTVTGSHGLMKYDGKHGIEECKASQIKPGELMPVVKAHLPYGTGPQALELERTKFTIKKNVSTILKDRDFGWFIGIFLAEGCIAYRKRRPTSKTERPSYIRIDCTEDEIKNRIASFCLRIGASYKYVKEGQSKSGSRFGGSAVIYHAGLCHFLSTETGRYAWGKKIPDIVWDAPRELAEGLIDGYFCGDGTVGDRQATISTTSREIAEGLCLILGSFGIRACARKYSFSNKMQKHPVWVVTIFGEYLSMMPFVSLTRKRIKLEQLSKLRVSAKFSRDRIPVPQAIRGKRIKLSNGKIKQIPYLSYRGRQKYRTIIEEGFNTDSDILFGKKDIWWDVVQSVRKLSPSERNDNMVYDLDMRPYGTFMVSSGLIVHNSFEDAIIISEDAAKKMATSRLYNFDQDTKNGVSISKNKYLAAFPSTFTKEQADKLDDNGVAKVGVELHRGDPILVATGPKLLSAENAQLGKLSSVLKNAVTDKSQIWNHDWPGVVTDVVAGPNGAKVLIKSEPPVKVGDKLCYDEKTEVLTSSGWKFMKDVTLDDYVATLDPETNTFEYLSPELIRKYEHKGRMYRLKNSCLDLKVTENHQMFVQRREHSEFEFLPAKDIFGKRVSYKKDAEWVGTEIKTFTFPMYQVKHRWGLLTRPEKTIPMDTYLMLLGMFLSEGNVRDNAEHRAFSIEITQVKKNGVEEARKALDASGIHYVYSEHTHKFSISGRHFAYHFRQFGHSYEKYIPDFVFGLSRRQQTILFNWLMWGDGHCKKGMPKAYFTSSPRMADDFQRLCLHIGKAGRVVNRDTNGTSHGLLDGRAITTKHDQYAVQIINHKLTPTVNHGHVHRQHVQEERWVDYDGFVYCCTMPKWHAIYVRRNGHACWCGNSPRFALKGVTGTVLSMDKMPRDAATNEPYDMLVNPMGFLSRVAPGQLMEISLGKVAKKTGQQIRIPQLPPPEGWLTWTKKMLADNGVSETTDVFDPQTGRTIKGVGDGYMYVQAMHHLAEKKYSARGIEGGYTQDQQPAKGGETGAKKISGFDVNALLSHGATEVLKDAMTVRGQSNENYWRRLRLGLPIPEPDVPFIYQKFLNNLRAGGINVVEKGDITSIMPQTDKSIEELAGGRIIDSSQMVDANMNPVKGGLFDLGKTGGAGGTRWSMIELPEPIPNPVMEEPVRRILGLTSKGLSDILSGKEQLNGKTGGAAIKEALANLDLGRIESQAQNDVRNKRGSTRDNAVKILGYLRAARQMNVTPQEWMITKVPVIPPAFRPVSKVGDTALIPDTNELYKELLETKHNYELLRPELPDEALTEERLNIYKAVKAAFGLGNSVTTEGQAKNLKGPIKQIIGTVPKWGQFQSKVVAKNQDLVGRSVTVPDKNLDMDQVGIPEDMAWTMYKPFVTRGLVKRGYSPMEAIKMIEERTPTARHILDDVMQEKPVLMDRAPTWHKFNIMAFKPFITDGKEIRVCPMIDSGFNMDHDGDAQIGIVRVKFSKNDIYKIIEEKKKKNDDSSCISLMNMLYFIHKQQEEL